MNDEQRPPAREDRREVQIVRTGPLAYEATNVRGGRLAFGGGDGPDFTPVELLLTAIAGCSAIDVDLITGKRAQPESFQVVSAGEKVKDAAGGSHLDGLEVTFTVRFPEGQAGDLAREMLPRAIEMSRDRLCTVSRTVQRGTPVAMHSDTGAS